MIRKPFSFAGHSISRMVVGILIFCSVELLFIIPAWAATAHESITVYNGPATCVACHQTEAEDMFGTVHYQWSGPTPNVPNIAGSAGKANKGFNTYCGTIAGSRRVSCWSCHVGNGGVPSSTVSPAQLNNIDCLLCHQDAYKRKPAGPFESLTFTDYQGTTRTWQLPVEDPDGNFSFEPDEVNMTISPLQAAQTVHRPTRASCLRCHAYAAGSDCGKRGDLSTATANAPVNVDVHMSPGGQNMSCQDCHQSQNHRVLGRGLDLRPNDRPERLTCLTSGCHSAAPHGDSKLNTHAAKVACQTCHIPTYAKLNTTEVVRDWNHPFFAAGLFNGQGGFKPEETREMNLTPSYAWFDGTSQVYVLGQKPAQNAFGEYELAAPNGSVKSTAAKIHPMKEHWSNSALHDATGQLIPHVTFTYFVTGDFSLAVADGMQNAGLSGSWTMADVHTYQTINHSVEPKDNALDCGQCHAAFSNGNPVRMNLTDDLGYRLKAPLGQVCIQCHNYKNPKSFEENHNKHVRSKKYDCSWCHTFTRPERNLIKPPAEKPKAMPSIITLLLGD